MERVVTRIYTPGSLYEESLIGTDETSNLASIVVKNDFIGLAILDASTGNLWAVEYSGEDKWDRILDDLLRSSTKELVFSPKDSEKDELREVILNLDNVTLSQHSTSKRKSDDSLKEILSVADLGHIDLGDFPTAMQAAGLAADYLSSMHLMIL